MPDALGSTSISLRRIPAAAQTGQNISILIQATPLFFCNRQRIKVPWRLCFRPRVNPAIAGLPLPRTADFRPPSFGATVSLMQPRAAYTASRLDCHTPMHTITISSLYQKTCFKSASTWRSFQRALSFWVRHTAALASFGRDPTSGGPSRNRT